MPLIRAALLASLALVMPILVTPALADADDEAALEIFSTTFADACVLLEDGSPREAPQRFTLTSPSTWGDPAEVILWQFRCFEGAYNQNHVWLIKESMYGIQPVAFARPVFETIHEDPENEESPIREISITGWDTSHFTTNSELDQEAGTIAEIAYWRGMGDASSFGVWKLENETFVLKLYEVDPTYDGEISHVTLFRGG